MALQASGVISFSDISNEFGLPPNKNLGAYRITQTVAEMQNLPLDAGIPQSVAVGSSSIRFSDFYSKRLNVIVDFHSPSVNDTVRLNARSRYIDENVTVIGGFRSRPENSSGTKVFIHVNVDVGSVKNNDSRYVALKTGGWDANTILNIDIGPSGRIFGAGGDGGNGAPSSGNGSVGGNGTSGLGIQYTITDLNNRGLISAGFAGGGGGGGGYSDPNKSQDDPVQGGGGGGGGAGYPSGSGGTTPNVPVGSAGYGPSGGPGQPGSAGTKLTRGLGGSARNAGGSSGGAGGPGGDVSNAAQKGADGSGNLSSGTGGQSGSNGDAIRVISGVTISNYRGSGSIYGGTSTGVEVL